jgi:hypothetical protein
VKRALAIFSVAIAACVGTGSAAADGLPVLGVDVGSDGVTVPASPDRYVTVAAGGLTIVERIARNGGKVRGIVRIPGNFTIPAVAYDASASGLSADGKTLVLIEPRTAFPRQMTRFALVDTRRPRLERTITLRGDFSFDAVSPSGRTMFLVNYTSPFDPTRYSVRAYDLLGKTLLPKPVRDPAERSDAMRGAPITRLMSTDGRWAYTLYDGAGGTPFVHALDTSTLSAHCIDLPMLAGGTNLWQLRFTRGPHAELLIGTRGDQLAVVDTNTFTASAPVVHGPSDRTPLLILGAALFAALALLVAVPAARRRIREGPAPAPSTRGV